MTEAVVSQLPAGTLAFGACYHDGDGVLLLSVFAGKMQRSSISRHA